MQNNVEHFIQYFEKGCKAVQTDNVGMELEHFVVNKKNKTMVGYSGDQGVEALLRRLLPFFPENNIQDGHLIALGNKEYVISIEPAAQIEVSIVPKHKISEIERIYRAFVDVIQPVLAEWNYELVCAGYCPNNLAEELKLIPKKRYEYMNRYFEKIGMYGRCMMRGTASVQLSLDYVSERDFVRTYRMAVALGPMLSLLMDNVKVFEKETWPAHLARMYIWERVDRKRCSVVPGTFEDDFGFAAYGSYVCSVSLIFIDDGKKLVYTDEKTFLQCMEGKEISEKDVEHGISIVFPDVRLKQYMEIRVADSVPIHYALGYAAFVKSLFKNRLKLYEIYKQFEQSEQLKQLEKSKQFEQSEKLEQFHGMSEKAVREGKESLGAYGWKGEIYGKPVGDWMDKLAHLAEEEAEEEDKNYGACIVQLIQNRKSVKDVLQK